MKKYLAFFVFATAMLLNSCSTFFSRDNKPNTFPALDQCTPKLLKSSDSFICSIHKNNTDFIETVIRFNTDSFTLDNQDKQVLNKLYAYLKLDNTKNIIVRGYDGKIDSKLILNKDIITKYSLRLSKNRAISVREYLLEKGLKDNIIVKPLGYQDPVAPNDSATDRELNQRVEITVNSRVLERINAIEKNIKRVEIANYAKFFANVYLLNQSQLSQIAEIYGSYDKQPELGIDSKIFVNKKYPIKQDDDSSKKEFTIISEPKSIGSFDNDKILYKEGLAKYDYIYKNITVLTIKNLLREIRVGDYVVPNDAILEDLPEKSFKISKKITANVIEDVKNKNNSLSASFDSVLINKGAADGLQLGAQMILYKPASRVTGFAVPPKYLGYGFVYRMSGHYAIVLVVNSLEEIDKGAMITTKI